MKKPEFHFDFSFIRESLGITISEKSPFYKFVETLLKKANDLIIDQYRYYIQDFATLTDKRLKKELETALQNNKKVYCGLLWSYEDDKKIETVFYDLLQDYEDENFKLIVDE